MSNWEERINKMLAIAEDERANPAEREAAAEKAMFFMAKFGITELTLRKNQNETVEPVWDTVAVTNPYQPLKHTLLHAVVEAFGGKEIRSNGVYRILAMPDDLTQIKRLFYSLLLQGAMGLSQAQESKPTYMHGKTFNHSWFSGFVNTVSYRVRNAANRASAEAKAETPGTDLVLADRTKVVGDTFQLIYPKTNTRTVVSARSHLGRALGAEAGRRADIGHTRLGGSRRALGT